MIRENLVLRVLTRLCPVVFMVLAAMVAKAEQRVTFSKIESSDAQHESSYPERFRACSR